MRPGSDVHRASRELPGRNLLLAATHAAVRALALVDKDHSRAVARITMFRAEGHLRAARARSQCGRDGFGAWVAHWGEAWESFAIEPGEYIDAGDKVVEVVRLSARGKGSGVPLERHDGMVWTLRDGQAVRLDYYGSRSEALEAVGLSH